MASSARARKAPPMPYARAPEPRVRFCRPVMSMRSVSRSVAVCPAKGSAVTRWRARNAAPPAARAGRGTNRAEMRGAMDRGEHNMPPRNALSAPSRHYDGPVPGASRRGEIALLVASLAVALAFGEGAARVLAPARTATGYAPVRTDRATAGPSTPAATATSSASSRSRRACAASSASATPSPGARASSSTTPSRSASSARSARERGERWEVVNLAQPGMNTVQEAASSARRASPTGPTSWSWPTC